ncbi:MAG: hypothetical protein GXP61_03815 [Epsilonproteobacteria bacterium]|nr:hypothetical protein [Campylobacterota bacterium]
MSKNEMQIKNVTTKVIKVPLRSVYEMESITVFVLTQVVMVWELIL